MFSLLDYSLMVLACALLGWLWHSHGIREQALALARRHCQRLEVRLLDDSVALRGFRWLADSQGRKRLARVYDFEVTFTGTERVAGSLFLFGRYLGGIELAQLGGEPAPFEAPHSLPAPQKSAQVIDLAQWKISHRSKAQPRDSHEG